MQEHLPPHRHAPIAARLSRAVARSLCRAAVRLYRAVRRMQHHEPPEDERHYAHALLVRYGKLD